jgi:hypothetical protein
VVIVGSAPTTMSGAAEGAELLITIGLGPGGHG